MQKDRHPAKRKFEKALKFFTLAVVPHGKFQEIYSKIGPDFKIPQATAEIEEQDLPQWHEYLGRCKEIEEYLNFLFSTGMPIIQNTTITVEDGTNYQVINFKYERIRGYDGLRVRILLSTY